GKSDIFRCPGSGYRSAQNENAAFSPHPAVVESGKQILLRRQEAGDRPRVRTVSPDGPLRPFSRLVRFGAEQPSGGENAWNSLPAGNSHLAPPKRKSTSAKNGPGNRDGECSDSTAMAQ